jgi:apolipoprotein N-acyltransferase
LPSRSSSYEYALAAASGVLLAFSFPKYGHPAVAWMALTPLLVALSGDSRLANPEPRIRSRGSLIPNPESRALARAFLLGLLTGVVYFTGTLYWITRVMAVYGGLQHWVAVAVNAALIVYLALFPAVFAVVVRRIVIAHGRLALMAAPLVWVATELGRTHIFTGFPWVLLGYSQTTVLPVAQVASVFGVYGVSMIVAAVSAALALAAIPGPPSAPPKARYVRFMPAAFVLAIVIAVAVWGSRRAASAEWTRAGDPIRIGLIQGNVEQEEKQNPARAAAIFESYLGMTRQALRQGAEFILWPESSTPFQFEDDPVAAARIRTLAQLARVPILVGSDQVERTGAAFRYYNAAFLVQPDGTTGAVYRKMHLVPFGEYVPLKRIFFFAAPLVEAVSDFSAGEDAVLLPVRGHPISTAICYEVVYPDLVRRFVAGGSEMLTTITNDAWFGPTSAPYQHFEQASMRAIEEGRYLVRSANTGISGIVDPYGRVVEKSAIFQNAVLVGEARFLRTFTFYARHGDVVAYASAMATAALLLLALGRP